MNQFRKGIVAATTLAALTGTLAPLSVAQASVSAPLTQQSAINQLIAVFGDVESYPKGLIGIDANGKNASWSYLGKQTPRKPSQWVGLACVFPGASPSQYASDLGIISTDSTGTVTASQVAQWIVKWEVAARQVQLNWEPSSDPYTLLNDFSFFYGTDVKGPNSVLNQKDMMAIRNNIVEVSRGWRPLGSNKVEMLAPLVDAQYSLSGTYRSLSAKGAHWKTNQWPTVYEGYIQTIDSQTFTFTKNGNVIYQYKHGTGYTANIYGSFMHDNDVVYSSYSFSRINFINYIKTGNKSVLARNFNEPTTEYFSPNKHLTTGTNDLVGYVAPAQNEIAFTCFGTVNDRYTASQGLQVAPELSWEFLYSNGHISKVIQTNSASLSYPCEVIAYD